MRILLVMPWDRRHRRYRSILSPLLSYPPLTLPVLAALVPDELDAQVQVFDEMTDRTLPPGPFDLAAITCLTAEAHRAYELADELRARGVYVVLGGYHPSSLPQEALEHADSIVIGEAETTWPRLLRDFAQGTPQRIYEERDFPADAFVDARRGVLKRRRYAPVGTAMASRGCPRSCSFCAISKQAIYRRRDPERVIDELRTQRIRTCIFYDPDFFGDRQYALDLMSRLESLKIRWAACASIAFARDEELLEAARRSGCMAVLIGFESMTTSSLASIDKDFMDPAGYREAVARIHSYGISVNGTFMLGLDSDTEQELELLPERVIEIGVDLAVFFILTPVPGTKLFDSLEAEGRILTRDWSRYTQADVVFQPKNLTPQRLKELYETTWKKVYSLRGVWARARNLKNRSFIDRALMVMANIGFKFIGRDLN